MYPVIEIFGRHIGTYGLMILCGTVAAFVAARLLTKVWGDWVYAYLFSIVFGIVGSLLLRPFAKSLNIIIHPSIVQGMSIKEIINFLFGEIVFFGGLIGGVAGLLVYCRIFRAKISNYASLGATCLPLAHAFGGVGCFFGGCCYGVEHEENNIFTIIFPAYPAEFENPYHAPAGVSLVNTQLLEASFLLLLFAAQTIIFRHKRQLCLPIYLIAYGVWRFAIEFWRGDAIRGYFAGLSTSQWVAILSCVIGCVILRLTHRSLPQTT